MLHFCCKIVSNSRGKYAAKAAKIGSQKNKNLRIARGGIHDFAVVPAAGVSRIRTDEHAPDKVWVNAVLSCTDLFYKTYKIREGGGMYVEPENRVRFW